ncbi:I78 family peptidase inhibitor [Stakelama marina]|uniref:Peptidase inhibitor I78 n=1 Tax=Stakelama marina TaxID=2826939 RepID=A0A8T4IH39_9SPHN|nr:I78 family peptidase inhibitor [Stakelama marina]MBR0551609.1 peptidase inhibitor I78 [Stakelama marina]
MRHAAILIPIGLLVTACAQTAPPEAQPPRVGAGSCDASGLDDLVGQTGTSDLAADAMERSGATRMRWIQPGMAVTMDYRTDRLNINLDDRNVVTGFKCG